MRLWRGGLACIGLVCSSLATAQEAAPAAAPGAGARSELAQLESQLSALDKKLEDIRTNLSAAQDVAALKQKADETRKAYDDTRAAKRVDPKLVAARKRVSDAEAKLRELGVNKDGSTSKLGNMIPAEGGASAAQSAVKEYNEQILFLRKIVPGATSRSYGIAVARLAGLPEAVLDRAKQVLANLESAEFDEVGHVRYAERRKSARQAKTGQMDLFGQLKPKLTPIEEELQALDVDGLTPVEALRALARLQEKLKI